MEALIELPVEQTIAPFLLPGSEGKYDGTMKPRGLAPQHGRTGMDRDVRSEGGKAVNEKDGETRSRRWLVLMLAGIAGFVGSGGALTPGKIMTVLLSLFVAVFLVVLALSLLTEPVTAEAGLLAEEPEPRTSYGGEVQPVGGAAVLDSP